MGNAVASNQTGTSMEAPFLAALGEARGKFVETNGDMSAFIRECEWAMQTLRRSSFLADVARRNPISLRDAIIQSAAVGVSLNPITAHAYLVPRDGAVCLDISYRGLRDTAVAEGVIAWGRAEVVFEADTFEVQTMANGDRIVTHVCDPLAADRGAIRGGYFEWQEPNGHRDAIFEKIAELYSSHRSRSESWKKSQSGIWKTDELEAIRKSLTKRAHKSWPRPLNVYSRLDAAVAASIHADGDTITMEPERPPLDADRVAMLTERAALAGTPIGKWCEFFGVGSLANLSQAQADDMSRRIEATLKRRAMDAAKQEQKDQKLPPPANTARPAEPQQQQAKTSAAPAAPLELTGEPTDKEAEISLNTEIDELLDTLAGGDGGVRVQYETGARQSAGLPTQGTLDLFGLTTLRDELAKAVSEIVR